MKIQNHRSGFIHYFLVILGGVLVLGVIGFIASGLGPNVLTSLVVPSPTQSTLPLAQNNNIRPTKPLIANGEVSIELDVPSYYPEHLRYPQHLFSGRKYIIRTSEKCTSAQCYFADGKTGQRNNFKKPSNIAKVKEIEKNGNAFVFEISPETKTGDFNFNYVVSGQKKTFTTKINGIEGNKSLPLKSSIQNFASKFIAPLNTLAATNPNFTVDFRNVISPCYWEMSLVGQPNFPNNLYHTCANSPLSRSNTGGLTWNSQVIDTITTYPRASIQYAGDQKIVALGDGSFYMSAMFGDHANSDKIGGILYKGQVEGNLTSTIFQDIVTTSTNNIFVDYPKLAITPDLSAIYISAFFAIFNNQIIQSPLYRSTNGGTSFIKSSSTASDARIDSMKVSFDNFLYAAGSVQWFFKLQSFNPTIFNRITVPLTGQNAAARISTLSNRAWTVYQGPEVIADAESSSPYRGRIHIIWSKPSSLIYDPLFEYGSYGYNFDIFSTYSDNSGVTWSAPLKINDDVGSGDQVFPSASIDSNGTLHVAWLDHRDNQDKELFDVYYANSTNGGVTFSPNFKVNVSSTPNMVGGRSVGDYLDMVVGYPKKAYVGYPCSSGSYTGPCLPGMTCSVTNADQACFASINLLPSTPIALPDWTNKLTAVWNLEENGGNPTFRNNSSINCGAKCNIMPNTIISNSKEKQEGYYSNNFIKTSTSRLYCNSSSCAPIKFPSSFTVGCWARPTTEATSLKLDSSSGFMSRGRFANNIYAKGYAMIRGSSWMGGKAVNYLNCIGGDGVVKSVNGISAQSGLNTFPTNVWTHAACRYDPTTDPDNFLWSSLVAITNGKASAPTNVKIAQDNLAEFNIGANYSTSSSSYFDGQLDECFATNSALSNASLCRIARCGIKGEQCTCSVSDPKAYISTGRALNCKLEAIPCNAPSPL